MIWTIPTIITSRIGYNIPPNPNSFDYYRRGEPILGLKGNADNKSFDYYRRNELPLSIVIIQVLR